MIILVITRANYPFKPIVSEFSDLQFLLQQQAYIWDGSTTLQTRCIADQIAMSDLNFYNTKQLKQLKDHRITFEMFRIDTICRFINKYYRLFENIVWNNKAQRLQGFALAGAMLDIADFYKEQGETEVTIIHILADIMFPKFKNPDDEHRWVCFRYNERKRIVSKLINSFKYYYSYMHITKHEADRIISDIKNDRFVAIRSLFTSLGSQLYSNKRCFWDGNSIGLGSVLFSLSMKNDGPHMRNMQGWKDGLLDFTFNDSMFYYITRYGITIVAHGDDMIATKNDWSIQATKNPFDLKIYRSISKLLLSLKDTFTRVNVLSCNPNKGKVYPELYKCKDFLVNIHEGKVFVG